MRPEVGFENIGLLSVAVTRAKWTGLFPHIRVEIAGSGPQRPDLEQRSARLGLTGRVEFLGWIDDLHTVLPRCVVFVLPSLEEGFPLAALEAMAAALPVVASGVGGVPGLVEDGKTG